MIHYGKNYGTILKNIVLNRKLWNFDLLWKNPLKTLWHYTDNYGTLIYFGKNNGTMKKKYGNIPETMVLY